MSDPCERLQQIWHEQIPISKAMGIQLVSFEGGELRLRAALEPNVNVHGTGFAGSLYAVAALCGWGLTHLNLEAAEQQASIVIARGEIDYRRPVAGDIECSGRFPADAALAELQPGARQRYDLTIDIRSGDRSCATFAGVYAIKVNARD
ncbi:MAG: YiiD C-terminal domain-containing protein [Pseudomonadota bacterium]